MQGLRLIKTIIETRGQKKFKKEDKAGPYAKDTLKGRSDHWDDLVTKAVEKYDEAPKRVKTEGMVKSTEEITRKLQAVKEEKLKESTKRGREAMQNRNQNQSDAKSRKVSVGAFS